MTKFRLAGTVTAIALAAAVATTAVVAQQARSNENGSPQAGRAAGPAAGEESDDLQAFLDLADDEGPRGRGYRGGDDMSGRNGDMPGEWRGRGSWGGDVGDRRRHGGPHAGMAPRGFLGLCGGRGERLAEMILMRLERVTRPSEAQRAGFDKLKEAAFKANEIARAGCPAEPSFTPTGRLANTEKRLEAMLQAVRTVRPAFEEFFASLNDEQKARIYAATSAASALDAGWAQRPRRLARPPSRGPGALRRRAPWARRPRLWRRRLARPMARTILGVNLPEPSPPMSSRTARSADPGPIDPRIQAAQERPEAWIPTLSRIKSGG